MHNTNTFIYNEQKVIKALNSQIIFLDAYFLFVHYKQIKNYQVSLIDLKINLYNFQTHLNPIYF